MLRLMDEHLSDDGSRVDYAALRVSEAFGEFREAVGALRSLPAETLGPSAPLDERKAFCEENKRALAELREQLATRGGGGASKSRDVNSEA